ncbi:MAG: hypothetical protein AB8B68_05560 [Rickettsiaceae bacterium]
MEYRGIFLSHKTVRAWCYKFAFSFHEVIRKREHKPKDKWHLDEMNVKINGEIFILWKAVDLESVTIQHPLKADVCTYFKFCENQI